MVLAHEPRPPRRARSSYIRRRVRSIHAANVLGLEKVPSPRCLMTSIGNERANAISEREPNNETDRESNFEARRHAAVTPPHEIGFRRPGGNDSPPRRLRAPAVF